MIRVREYDATMAIDALEKPLKEWRTKFESNNLTSADLMQYFHVASPLYLTIEQSANYQELGKFSAVMLVYWVKLIRIEANRPGEKANAFQKSNIHYNLLANRLITSSL